MDSIKWQHPTLILLDQTKLPMEESLLTCTTWQDVRDAIAILAVRGAPAIGVAAAYGVVLAGFSLLKDQPHIATNIFLDDLAKCAQGLIDARPTAVNLAWAVNQMLAKAQSLGKDNVAPDIIINKLEETAMAIHEEDIAINTNLSRNGAQLLKSCGKPLTILTHCNAGALATAGIGTALGVIRALHAQQSIEMVYADETRPLLQGARLTAFELKKDNIPVTLITDNMAGWVMKTKKIDAVIVGADRITHNGDTANKIGTYSLSILAKFHKIPFYIAAPVSTFDLSLEDGADIPIEERNHDEVRSFHGTPVALPDTTVFNPAFDVTPHENITGIITEFGIIHKPDRNNITAFFKGKGVL